MTNGEQHENEVYQTVVDEAVEGRVGLEEFLDELRHAAPHAGASAAKASDYG